MYSDEQRCTVPMEVLERNLAEGKQAKGTSYAPFRVLAKRKAVLERKTITNSILAAGNQPEEIEAFLTPFHNQAEDAVAASARKRGPNATYMTCTLKALETDFKTKHTSPHYFEKVLQWKHTDKVSNQATSKHPRNT